MVWKQTLSDLILALNCSLFIFYSVTSSIGSCGHTTLIPEACLWHQHVFISWFLHTILFSRIFIPLFFHTDITTSLTGHLAILLFCSLQICMCNILLAVYISLKCLFLFINVFSIQLFTLNHQKYESVSVSSYMV